MNRLSKFVSSLGLLALASVAVSTANAQSLNAYPKWSFDNGNTGWNPNETILNTANVNVNNFGKLWQHSLDGQVYAQPLYVANLTVNGSQHNVVYVCTENDSVYAFDADSSTPPNDQPLWQVSLGSSVSSRIIGCSIGTPVYGITGTPVIDV